MATMKELYESTPFIKNALLNADGSVQDISGAILLPENAARRRIYEGLPFIKNAFINADGSTQKISDSGGGGGGLTVVAHDASLTGDGTTLNPLKIAQSIVDQLNATISSEQDPANAGKVFVVGEDGTVELTSVSVSGLSEVAHDTTLEGNGTAGDELGIAQSILDELADTLRETQLIEDNKKVFRVGTDGKAVLSLLPEDAVNTDRTLLYVDSVLGDDTNTGSATRPVKTLAGLLALAATLTDAQAFAITFAPGTYTGTGDIVLPNKPIVIYGNGASITTPGTITIPNPNFTRYNLFTTANTVVFSNFAVGARVLVKGGGITGNVTINAYAEFMNCQLNGGVVTVGATGQAVISICSPTSTFVSAGSLFMDKINISTNKATTVVNSTAGLLSITQSYIINAGAGLCVSCDNGATTAFNSIINCSLYSAGGTVIAAGAAATIADNLDPNGCAVTGTALSGAGYKMISGNTQVKLGSDATGDLYYRDALGKLQRLQLGAQGTVLSAGETTPEYITKEAIVDIHEGITYLQTQEHEDSFLAIAPQEFFTESETPTGEFVLVNFTSSGGFIRCLYSSAAFTYQETTIPQGWNTEYISAEGVYALNAIYLMDKNFWAIGETNYFDALFTDVDGNPLVLDSSTPYTNIKIIMSAQNETTLATLFAQSNYEAEEYPMLTYDRTGEDLYLPIKYFYEGSEDPGLDMIDVTISNQQYRVPFFYWYVSDFTRVMKVTDINTPVAEDLTLQQCYQYMLRMTRLRKYIQDSAVTSRDTSLIVILGQGSIVRSSAQYNAFVQMVWTLANSSGDRELIKTELDTTSASIAGNITHFTQNRSYNITVPSTAWVEDAGLTSEYPGAWYAEYVDVAEDWRIYLTETYKPYYADTTPIADIMTLKQDFDKVFAMKPDTLPKLTFFATTQPTHDMTFIIDVITQF